jgi:hypothetical protein
MTNLSVNVNRGTSRSDATLLLDSERGARPLPRRVQAALVGRLALARALDSATVEGLELGGLADLPSQERPLLLEALIEADDVDADQRGLLLNEISSECALPLETLELLAALSLDEKSLLSTTILEVNELDEPLQGLLLDMLLSARELGLPRVEGAALNGLEQLERLPKAQLLAVLDEVNALGAELRLALLRALLLARTLSAPSL